MGHAWYELPELHKKLRERAPSQTSYKDEGELIDDFLSNCQKDCNYCDGKSHKGSTYGFGCGLLHGWVEKHRDLIETTTGEAQ